MERLRPFFPKPRGRARVDDRQVLSGIIHVQRNGLMWQDAPAADGHPKALYNRWKRGSRRGVFARISAGQTSDYVGARALLSSLLKARVLLADRGYDADWFRWALTDRGIQPCIPSRKGRTLPVAHDPNLYRHRHRIENAFGRLKDWRHIATRYDRLARNYLASLALVSVVIAWT